MLWHLATRTTDKTGKVLTGPPWKPPKRALPPKEIDVDKTAVEAQKMADAVFAAREQINQLESHTARKAALIKLKEGLNIRSDKEFSQLMRLAAQEKNPSLLPTSPREILALELEWP